MRAVRCNGFGLSSLLETAKTLSSAPVFQHASPIQKWQQGPRWTIGSMHGLLENAGLPLEVSKDPAKQKERDPSRMIRRQLVWLEMDMPRQKNKVFFFFRAGAFFFGWR